MMSMGQALGVVLAIGGLGPDRVEAKSVPAPVAQAPCCPCRGSQGRRSDRRE